MTAIGDGAPNLETMPEGRVTGECDSRNSGTEDGRWPKGVNRPPTRASRAG